jgi:RNA polymerase sigma-70 factor (ECF subfamily)
MEPIAALKRGDPEAISWFVDTFSQRLLKAATLMLGDQYLAEDAVQDCLIDAISHLSSFRGDASLYTWLYAILLRRCNRQRKRNRAELGQSFSREKLERIFFKAGRYEGLPPLEQKNQVRAAIRALNYKQREVIVLFYYEEFTIKGIAALLAEPEGTIKNRLYRARQKLKLQLEGEEELCL